jgi:hypothetical protein
MAVGEIDDFGIVLKLVKILRLTLNHGGSGEIKGEVARRGHERPMRLNIVLVCGMKEQYAFSGQECPARRSSLVAGHLGNCRSLA